jgi:hypothetical protein
MLKLCACPNPDQSFLAHWYYWYLVFIGIYWSIGLFSPPSVQAANWVFGEDGYGNFIIKDRTTGSVKFQMDTSGSVSLMKLNATNLSAGQFGANTGGGNYTFPANLVISSSVGIGTTDPGSYKLNVQGGNINTSGTVTWSEGGSANANTAYTHSQSTHVGLTGANASGTWAINVTGSAGNVAWNNVSGKPTTVSGYGITDFISSNSGSSYNIDSAITNGHYYVNGVSLFGQSDGAAYVQSYSSSWVGQIYQDYRTGQLALRGRNNGSWQSWRTVWDNLNDGSGSGLDADTLDSYNTSTAGSANTIALRDANGDLTVRYLNFGSGPSITTDGTNRINLNASGYTYVPSGVFYVNGMSHLRGGIDTDQATYLTIAGGTSGYTYFSGNVGIGTTDPSSAKLVVAGNILSTGGTIYNGNTTRRWVTDGSWNTFYTDNGYIQLGPANSSWAHIYSDKNFYFNQNLYVSGNLVWHQGNDGSGSGLDADNLDGIGSDWLRNYQTDTSWAYNWYLAYNDPWSGWARWRRSGDAGNYVAVGYADSAGNADTCDSQHLGTGNSPTFYDLYVNEWFRNNDAGQGLYNSATGMHFYSENSNYWALRSNYGMRFLNNDWGTAGYVYHDYNSNNFGLLSGDGNWRVRVYNGGQELYGTTQINTSGYIRGASYGFGGMYSINEDGPSCQSANPFTGGCSCPSGFSDFTAGGTAYNWRLHLCYR